ncbi:ATP-binding cassette domain-containing protein [bacterium]|nr:ATP-binding cassette domain-containing protein [bacterium]
MVIKGLGLEVSAKPTSTARARRVQEAFGIVATEFKTLLLKEWDLVVHPGDAILVGGPSGSGKSLLLRAIRFLAANGRRQGRLPKGVNATGIRQTERINIAVPRMAPPNKSPIELLADKPLDDALKVLANAGLAEAQLFVRPAKTLSLGQNYRLALALALAQDPKLLIIDEFCEPLDYFTTAAVARRLRQTASHEGIAIIAATADPKRVINFFQPTRLVLLSSDGKLKTKSGSFHL